MDEYTEFNMEKELTELNNDNTMNNHGSVKDLWKEEDLRNYNHTMRVKDKQTIIGDSCPNCDSNNFYGHLDLKIFKDGMPGVLMRLDCIECGEGGKYYTKFRELTEK